MARQREATQTPRLSKAKRESILRAVERRERVKLVKNTRATFWDSGRQCRVVCTISKHYPDGGYWYAYHPKWDDFLKEGETGLLLLGCVDLDIAFAIPRNVILEHLNDLNTTTTKADPPVTYWHIIIVQSGTGEYELTLRKRDENLSLTKFVVSLAE